MEFGSALAGLVLVTANPAFPATELSYVFRQSSSIALFQVDKFRGNPMTEIGATVAEGLGEIREIVNLNDVEALYAKGSMKAELPEVLPNDAAQIIITFNPQVEN